MTLVGEELKIFGLPLKRWVCRKYFFLLHIHDAYDFLYSETSLFKYSIYKNCQFAGVFF